MGRRATPVMLGLAAAVLLASYIFYTRKLTAELMEHSRRTSVLYARIYQALYDTTGLVRTDSTPAATVPSSDDGTLVLLELSTQIRNTLTPIVITDVAGKPLECINLPFCDPLDDAKAREAASAFDREVAPIRVTGDQFVHFGFPVVVRAMRMVPVAQAAALLLVVAAGFVYLRERARAQRERIWAGMARESAHQIATPLSSLNGWLELLRDRDLDDTARNAVDHMGADVARLERVAHRFERIGRPAVREDVDVGAVALSVVEYFRARLPRIARGAQIICVSPESPAVVRGDAVLLEWAFESLVKNALDAMSGREGTITVSVAAVAEGQVIASVSDEGPGVPRELRSLIFQPGFSTKAHGWGVGLALTRRIVEENHGGELSLATGDSGATFQMKLH